MSNIVNTSGIHPVGHTVLILPKAVEEKTKSGIIISTASELDRLEMAQMYATVIEVSPLAWSDVKDGAGLPVEPLVKQGDHIIFAKYAGHLFEGNDGVQYRLISDLDVKAKVDLPIED
jgi:co-chaperonin GroES (HSP10)